MASRNVETLRAAHQGFNRRDFDAVANNMTENAIYHDRARDLIFQGRTGFKEFMQGRVTAFSNSEVTEPTYIDAGDTVIAQFTGKGVNDGPFGGLAPTGKPVKFYICEIFQFNGEGKVVSGAIYYDQLSLLAQLGHIQLPKQAVSA